MAMKDAEPVVAKAGAERRRFRRVRVDLPGRLFIPADSHEARCTVTDLSPGGAAIASEIVPEAGTGVVLYVDNFGRFEGTVVRRDGYGFGVALAALAGVLAAPINQVRPLMGADFIIVVFAVVVIGGMGSIMGSIVTGFMLGVIEGLTKVFYPEASNTVVFADPGDEIDGPCGRVALSSP